MTPAEKIASIEKILAGQPVPAPLPESMEQRLRALATDWLESRQHAVYGQAILDVLDGN